MLTEQAGRPRALMHPFCRCLDYCRPFTDQTRGWLELSSNQERQRNVSSTKSRWDYKRTPRE
jgi:hypothetical protein